jgi:hypothetical protein
MTLDRPTLTLSTKRGAYTGAVARGRRGAGVMRSARCAAAFAAVALLGCAVVVAACGTSSAEPLQSPSASKLQTTRADSFTRGIFDDAWVKASGSKQRAIVAELADKLHVQVLRIDLRWSLAEPASAGRYDAGYLGRIRTAVTAARTRGMKVMIDVFGVPRWASDSSFWSSPPDKAYGKGYQPFYPVAAAHLDEWEDTAAYLGRYFKGNVAWWECWNEPNLWSYIYPQTKAGDAKFAAREYVKLLQRFYRAMGRSDPAAKVLGGVTAPFGMNDKMRTAPQRFLADLKSLGAAEWWDGVSHHPYMPAGVKPMPGPKAKPSFPQYTVTLGNISTVLKIFPGEPFYLTEYGYPTKASTAWGRGYVSEKTQASYLTTAYRYAAGFKQVKMLSWFLWKDINKGANRPENAYFGLVRANGTKKPSWYAYARLR